MVLASVGHFSLERLNLFRRGLAFGAELVHFGHVFMFERLPFRAQVAPAIDQFTAQCVAPGAGVHEQFDLALVVLEANELPLAFNYFVVVLAEQFADIEREFLGRQSGQHEQTVAHLVLRDGAEAKQILQRLAELRILVIVAQGHEAEAAPFALGGQQQEFAMVLRGFEHGVLLAGEAGADGLRLAHLVLFINEVGGIERPLVGKPLRLAAGRFALPTPAEDALSTRAETFEENVAVLVREVIVARLLRRVGAEVHVPTVIEVEELKRVDERGLAGVVRPDDLQRPTEFHLGVIIAPGADENELFGAVCHGYSLVAAGVRRL